MILEKIDFWSNSSYSWVIFVESLLYLTSCDHFLPLACLVCACCNLSAALLEEIAAVSPLPAPGAPAVDSPQTLPQLPARACLLASAQSCAAQLEDCTPGFPIRGKLCMCARLSGWCAGSCQPVNNTSGGAVSGRSQSGVDVRAKAMTWLSCCFVVTDVVIFEY